MKRPLDPRHHGGKEPKRVHSKVGIIYLDGMFTDDSGKLPITTLLAAWKDTVKDHESQGHRITEGLSFRVGSLYGRSISLEYTYEWDNLNYVSEITEWNAALTEYEQKFAAWKQYEEDRKQILISGTKNIDALIERAEHRLANLKAKKAGEPLPYPEG
jgi:hypothetical protein